MGFLGRLAKQAATRAIDIALARMLPVDLVQSTPLRDTTSLKRKEPERVLVAQAPSSPEVSPSMSEAIAKNLTEQQDPGQAELPWKKYERPGVPDDDLPTEQLLRHEKTRKSRDASLSSEALELEPELERR